ncbi:MAG: 7-carboxy-7-deazaguanine synthase QueE [Deltaproteobacteria bacterium]|nr:7-carboxy-7-deazaguanine synthase QueE [Deltaproteobacteria bacterium]
MGEQANIVEIFSSLQGEGPRVGEQQLFVRFQDCELSCKFCDTPAPFSENRFCRVEQPAFSKRFKSLSNPLSVETLNQIIEEFNDEVISITGGEPLQKTPFLKEWLPTLHEKRTLLLETAGVHVSEFREIVNFITIVSMDFKLPSSTGMHPWWREHEAFLKIAKEKNKEIYIKAVMTSETTGEDLEKAMGLINSIDPMIPLILQPATAFGRFREVPTVQQISQLLITAQKSLPNVRVIPQLHKQLGIL